MNPIPPPTSSTTNRQRRRSDLFIPLPPKRDTSLAVPLPLPLPPPSAPSSSSSSATTPPHPTPPAFNFSELERLNRVGNGNGGTVYKVLHRPSMRFYALKVIHGNHEESVRNQIRREIEILRAADHPNVVKCHDLFDHAGDIQVLLEFMDKGSLEGRKYDESSLSDLTKQPPVAPPTASREFREFISCCLQRDPAKRWTAFQLLNHPFVTGVHQGKQIQIPTQLPLPPPPPHFSSS